MGSPHRWDATCLKTLHRVNERDSKRNRAYGRYGKDDHGNYRHLLYSWLDACYALAKNGFNWSRLELMTQGARLIL